MGATWFIVLAPNTHLQRDIFVTSVIPRTTASCFRGLEEREGHFRYFASLLLLLTTIKSITNNFLYLKYNIEKYKKYKYFLQFFMKIRNVALATN